MAVEKIVTDSQALTFEEQSRDLRNPLHQLLADNRYSSPLIERAKQLRMSDEPESFRNVLEYFFRETVARAPALQGVPFTGNDTNFHELREFFVTRHWLSDKESAFVATFYGLLSEPVHQASPLPLPSSVLDVLRYITQLVWFRMECGVSPIPVPKPESAQRYALAKQFLHGVRSRNLSGQGFQAEFDEDLMNLTRDLLLYSDPPLLFEVIVNEGVSPGIRNRCASIIISPRSFRNAQERTEMVDKLWAHYQSHVESMPWQLSRAIAFALANRANFADCILDYVERLEADETIREFNLSQSDSYYHGAEVAMDRYLKRLANTKIPNSGCVWEAYYLSYRCVKEYRGDVRKLLVRRLKTIESPRLKTFWERTINALTTNQI